MSSNLPPGVTNKMIDDQVRDFVDMEAAEYAIAAVEDALRELDNAMDEDAVMSSFEHNDAHRLNNELAILHMAFAKFKNMFQSSRIHVELGPEDMVGDDE